MKRFSVILFTFLTSVALIASAFGQGTPAPKKQPTPAGSSAQSGTQSSGASTKSGPHKGAKKKGDKKKPSKKGKK